MELQESQCLICRSTDVRQFFEAKGVPTQDGALWPTADAAKQSPVGDIRMVCCANCGFMWNRSFDASKLVFSVYHFSLQHSPLFQKYVESVAGELIARYSLAGKTVVDIGCGRGHFLKTLCALSDTRGIGIDPSLTQQDLDQNASDRVTLIRDYFQGTPSDLKPDLVCCRHVIDLTEDPKAFFQDIARVYGGGGRRTPVYLEVPNSLYTLEHSIVWNLVYEHHSWFVQASMRALFEACGCSLTGMKTCWNDEYLSAEGVLGSPPVRRARSIASGSGEILRIVSGFAEKANRVLAAWSSRIDALRSSGRRVAIWGAGARAISFLSAYNVTDIVSSVVDISPERQGMYLPRTAYRVDAPETLRGAKPDTIIISNPSYAKEIRQQAEGLGVVCEFEVLEG